MRRIWIALLLVGAVAPAAQADDEATLREIKLNLWPSAYATQDVELLDSILHDSFEMIDNDGNRYTKSAELKWVAENAHDPGNFVYEIERLEIYQDRFAVIDGTGTTDTYTYKSSNFLIKEDGRWQAIASHVSGYKQLTEESGD